MSLEHGWFYQVVTCTPKLNCWRVNSFFGGDVKWTVGEVGQELVEFESGFSLPTMTSVIGLPSIDQASPIHRVRAPRWPSSAMYLCGTRRDELISWYLLYWRDKARTKTLKPMLTPLSFENETCLPLVEIIRTAYFIIDKESRILMNLCRNERSHPTAW